MEMTDRQKQIKDLYDQGLKSKEISQITGYRIHQVNHTLYKELYLNEKKKPVSIKDITIAKELRKKGLKFKEVAKEMNSTIERVKYLIGTYQTKVTKADIKVFHDLWLDQMSCTKIAVRTGFKYKQVYYQLQKMGLVG
jgi:hypothetical protein